MHLADSDVAVDAFPYPPEKDQTAKIFMQKIQEGQDKVKPVVVIDDAHLLKSRILDEFRIFCDFDFGSRGYVSVILIGNDGIRNSIRKVKYERLRDRIVANYEMRGMDREKTVDKGIVS